MTAGKLLSFLVIFSYGVSSLHYVLYLPTKKEKLLKVGEWGAKLGLLFNFALILLFAGEKVVPFSPKGVFLVLSFAVASVFVFYSLKKNLDLSGPFLMPVATLFAILSVVSKNCLPNVHPSTVGTIHIVLALFGYGFFIFAGVTSGLYLLLDAHLKKKKPSVFFFNLTSLPSLEQTIYTSVGLGFVFITVSMFAGAIWSQQVFGTYWLWHPKQVATLVVWLFYASVIHLYLNKKWKGRRFCYLNLLGVFVIFLNFIGVNLTAKGDVHAF